MKLSNEFFRRSLMRGIKLWILFVLPFLFAHYVMAQEQDVLVEREVIATAPVGAAEMMPFEEAVPAAGSFVFISSLFEMGDKVVKGAPYSADAVTERIQTLSDGNRIIHKNNSQVFRDSAGRIRREQEFGVIGNWVSAETPERHIFINDPVAGVHYVLEPENQIARKMKLADKGEFHWKGHPRLSEDEDHVFTAPAPGRAIREKIRMRMEPKDARKESLGKQNIEGVEAEGTRTVATIAAGEIGNERPIETITEKWYSPELKLYVMTRHMDPRFGETIYRLTNIKRGEPDASLFQVPSNYKIEEGHGPQFKFKRKIVD
jgi:hypothetical protein